VDIATFIQTKDPQSDVQFVTAVAFYYRFVAPEAERRDSVNAEFVQNATRTGRWDRLKNPLTTLNNAKAKGYLDSAARGEFKINTVGENLVDRTLPLANAGSAARKSSGNRVTKRSAKGTGKGGRKSSAERTK
jgi:hypothetical protein